MKLTAVKTAAVINNNRGCIDAEIGRVNEQLARFERQAADIGNAASTGPLDYNRLVDVMNDHDLAERRKKQLTQIRSQLFPGA